MSRSNDIIDAPALNEALGDALGLGVARMKRDNPNNRQKDLADAMGRSESLFSLLKAGGAVLTVEDIARACAAGVPEPLEELARRCGFVVSPVSQVANVSLERLDRDHMRVMAETHDLLQKFAAARSDGRIDAKEAAELAEECQQVTTETNHMIKDLRKVAGI